MFIKRVLKAMLLVIVITIGCKSNAQRKLGILGSSTAACFGSSQYDSCWVRMLQVYYGAEAITDLAQVAQGGYSPYQGMPTSYVQPPGRPAPDPNKNITFMLQQLPTALIVNYPSNGYDIYTVPEVMQCLRTIRDSATQQGVKCYITTPQPRSAEASFRTPETCRRMAEIKDSVLNQFGYFAINFYDSLVNPADSTILSIYDSGDHIHLNNAGHKLLVRIVTRKDIFNAVLPFSKVGVRASINNNKVVLKWSHTDPQAIKKFEIEKSVTNNANFKTIAAINVSVKKDYEYADNELPASFAFYRIQAVMLNGSKEFSNIVKITGDKKLTCQQVIIKKEGIWLKLNSPQQQHVAVSVYDISGKKLFDKKLVLQKGDNDITANFFSGTKANYILKITAGEQSITKHIQEQ
jgi:hypothetical protein